MRDRLLSVPGITGIAVALIGIVLAIGGAELLHLGGTLYYLVTGVLLTVSGGLIVLRRALGIWVYAAVIALTLLWSLYEVQLDGWALVPRLIAPAVLGIWIALPWVAGRLGIAPRLRWGGAAIFAGLIAFVFVAGWATTALRWHRDGEIAAAVPVPAPDFGVAPGDWRYYGRTAAGERYSPLAEITPDNVAKLQVAWTFHTGDLPQPGENAHGHEFNFEATPIKVGDTMYLCTPHRDIVALDPVTGQQRWRFHPQNDTKPNIYLACRGVAYATVTAPGDTCPERIISTTADARLFALDARTGKLCPSFGQNGFVDLRQGMGVVPPGFHFISSQPMIAHGKIMLSGWVYDNQTEGEPSGVIRAFDATTGQLAWAWDLGRADPTAPLKPGEIFTRGTPNGWGAYTADDKLGMVYVPLGNATPDYWGAHRRPSDEQYSSSIVALDIDTGRERWHFQTVHHDVWDFDVPIAGSLVDLPDGTPALIQTTKHGQLFLLDRRNGHPIAQVDEKKVPQNGLPGDRLSPTQPMSVGMPSLTPATLRPQDTWGATPIDQMLCRIELAGSRNEGLFTPPSIKPTIVYPAFDGVIDWHGGTIDPARHLFIANTSYIPFVATATAHDEAIKKGLIYPWAGWASGQPYPQPPEFANGPEYGTPWEVTVKPWLNLLGAPCMRPAWGKMVAIDLATRKIVWERPVGTTRDMGLFGTHTDLPLPTGIFNIGGNTVTAGGLIFVGAYADDYIRAIDERSGKILWRARLPAGGQATPAVYQGRDGREYVVIAAGGHGGLGTRNGDAVIAYAVPRR
ncbi:membrane-bound PQQ-dependent dehydrogenase, glucose/quinate/shikimate family [Sphingomonas nostoxanthinifaciens]|uniref:membrane-bound PQQ-dependent dehydrogenase, glucose/quinate/shikimate family n=1 Tax=Sphingomonas nostoxanthinifaciens TaxID=2872652 RepID=UPI001CC1D807|nr:membrane-bound PQQ-dependent dehydrogenase, glucose/quinate/shikimate family [Sphingomonas nostoxanthinifaciens]UAK26324.1 membrane-bound PQQ-dependent dehydrogenase, glucose/quinate/shikimate family [Sphingomonas nostoxanthinifaciens]